jgi:DNA-binding transcriptional MerR regulator
MGWLLSPSGRTDSGYRLYSERDLERLQEILGWRALGFSLDEVSHDQVSAPRTQRELVDAELARLAGLARRSIGRPPLSNMATSNRRK